MKKLYDTLKYIATLIVGFIILLIIITQRISQETHFYRIIFGKSDIIKQTELVGVWYIEEMHIKLYEDDDISYFNALANTGETIYYKDGTGITIIYADKDTVSFTWHLQGSRLGMKEMSNDHSSFYYREVVKYENDQLVLRGVLDRDESSEILIESVLRKAK